MKKDENSLITNQTRQLYIIFNQNRASRILQKIVKGLRGSSPVKEAQTRETRPSDVSAERSELPKAVATAVLLRTGAAVGCEVSRVVRLTVYNRTLLLDTCKLVIVNFRPLTHRGDMVGHDTES